MSLKTKHEFENQMSLKYLFKFFFPFHFSSHIFHQILQKPNIAITLTPKTKYFRNFFVSDCFRFHQVDSNDLTIAVNFWWRSNITSGLSEHMDAYYLRRILRRYLWLFPFKYFF